MNKGFTLIEIMGIVLILTAIFLVSFPLISNWLKDDNDKQYKTMVDNLCLAGQTYMIMNIDDFDDRIVTGNTITIKVEELIMYGNIDKNTTNPKTKNTIEDDEIIYTVLNDRSFDCVYKEKNQS